MQGISKVAVVLFMTFVVSSAVAQDPRPHMMDNPRDPAAASIARLLQGFLASANDPAAHERFWADNVMYVSFTGRLRTKAEILASVRGDAKQLPHPVETFSAADIVVRSYGDVAVVNFVLLHRFGPPLGPRHEGEVRRFRNTAVLQRTAAGWQAVSWQSTFVPEPPTD